MKSGEKRTNEGGACSDLRISHSERWTRIDWERAERKVRQLQSRIVKAEREGRRGKVRSLQRILTHSFSARALSVKRVTSNKGSRTAGVDGERWTSSASKGKAVERLGARPYRAKPLRRIYIPKKNGKKRPLGIPTMFDRAMQALYLQALDPIAECQADNNSYGFRKYRSTADAIRMSFLALCHKGAAHWILEGDIKGCFDHIDHQWLLDSIPMERRVLRQWLKAGYMENNALRATMAGTPQGGIASPTLANMALDGLETELYRAFRRTGKVQGKVTWVNLEGDKNRHITFIRYADDFIITGVSRRFLEDDVKPRVREFLSQRGLSLSEEKTRTTHITEGIDFLGMNIRKRDNTLLITPAARSVQALREKVRSIAKRFRAASAYELIARLNPLLRGWSQYYRNVCSSKTFGGVSHYLYQTLMRWACRRHPNKGKRWIVRKYFRQRGNRRWTFFGRRASQVLELFNITKVHIREHIKIRGECNPYAPEWRDYIERRSAQGWRRAPGYQ